MLIGKTCEIWFTSSRMNGSTTNKPPTPPTKASVGGRQSAYWGGGVSGTKYWVRGEFLVPCAGWGSFWYQVPGGGVPGTRVLGEGEN